MPESELEICPDCHGIGCPGFKLVKRVLIWRVKCSFCRETGKDTAEDIKRILESSKDGSQ